MFSFLLSNLSPFSSFFFFNDTATTEIYTLSLHDALPICCRAFCLAKPEEIRQEEGASEPEPSMHPLLAGLDRKSTRLNSSHPSISYAVFCLKKKKNNNHS